MLQTELAARTPPIYPYNNMPLYDLPPLLLRGRPCTQLQSDRSALHPNKDVTVYFWRERLPFVAVGQRIPWCTSTSHSLSLFPKKKKHANVGIYPPFSGNMEHSSAYFCVTEANSVMCTLKRWNILRSSPQNKTRQDKTRQDEARQDKRQETRQDKTRQDKTRQDKTRQDKTRQDKTRQGKARQGKR